MRVILLGSPGEPGDPIERWHDDAYQGCKELGWDVSFLRARDSSPEDITRAARGADWLLWMRTHDYNIRGGDGAAMLRGVEDAGVRTAGVHFDLYWGIPNRQARIGVEPWWSAQHVFTSDGGARDWVGKGVNHHWCPSPFGTRYLGHGIVQQRHDAVFVGSVVHRIHARRQRLLSWARATWGRGFKHVGRSREARVYGSDLNDLFAGARVVLGDSAEAPNYWSDRVVRTLGRGGLLAYPQTPGMEELGFDDSVMITFTSGKFNQILDRLNSLSDVERKEMTDRAIGLVESKHLWRHRLTDIARTVLA